MIAIIGGGISGLSAAWHLAQTGKPFTLFEKQPRWGGVIETAYWEDCVLEAGPDSFLAAKPEAFELIRELGLQAELIASNDHQRVTFVWKNGRMRPLPDGLVMMAPTRILPVALSPLLSWRTKVRMGLELFSARPGPKSERSVADFVREHYGQETVDYLAEPLLSGVYGGDVESLSVNAVLPRFVELEAKYGSLTRGVLQSRKSQPAGPSPSKALFATLKGGLGQLVEALHSRLVACGKLVCGEVEALERSAQGWRLRLTGDWMEADSVVLAVPAYQAAKLLAPHDARLASLLNSIEYSSSITMALVYRNLPRRPTGFGFLVPRKERRHLMAGTWVQNKFPHRAPGGYAILRCFIGGAGSEALLSQSDEAILRAALSDVQLLTGISRAPDHHRISRWSRSMAQYTLGHQARVREIEERIKPLGRLFLAGNAYSGIGIPDCIRTGRLAAEKALALSPHRP
ncbi:MAG: protoporphyrinogen oxidase [Bryobacteraceae bacterium]|nr:protoporphyrinogen oxidase [Bryobacteraceae bacterium]MDW8379200.1 protoporphyrinogen oxidase [Bryobacterales bacterium]